jgi:hypothetical protein
MASIKNLDDFRLASGTLPRCIQEYADSAYKTGRNEMFSDCFHSVCRTININVKITDRNFPLVAGMVIVASVALMVFAFKDNIAKALSLPGTSCSNCDKSNTREYSTDTYKKPVQKRSLFAIFWISTYF